MLLEEDASLVALTRTVWDSVVTHTQSRVLFKAIGPRLISWFTLMITPAGAAMDPKHVLVPRGAVEGEFSDRGGELAAKRPKAEKSASLPLVVGGAMQALTPDPEIVMAARLQAATLMGEFAGSLYRDDTCSPKVMYSLVMQMLKPNSATKRQLAGVIVSEWQVAAHKHTDKPPFADAVVDRLTAVLTESVSFSELEDIVKAMRSDVKVLLATYIDAGVSDELIASVGKPASFTPDTVLRLIDMTVHTWEGQIFDDAFASEDATTHRKVLAERLRTRVAFLGTE